MVTKNKSISIEAYNKEQNKPFTVYDFDKWYAKILWSTIIPKKISEENWIIWNMKIDDNLALFINVMN